MAAFLITQSGATPDLVVGSARRATTLGTALGNQLAADCIYVAMTLREHEPLDASDVTVSGAALGSISLEDRPIASLTLQECFIDELVVGPFLRQSDLVLRNCTILKVVGVEDGQSLPSDVFQECEIEAFDAHSTSTNSAIVTSDLRPSLKALLTVLRKLFLQAGGGRQLAALKRGIPAGPILNQIESVVRLLEAEGLITIYGGVAHPIRRHTNRVRTILSAPTLSDDPLVKSLE